MKPHLFTPIQIKSIILLRPWWLRKIFILLLLTYLPTIAPSSSASLDHGGRKLEAKGVSTIAAPVSGRAESESEVTVHIPADKDNTLFSHNPVDDKPGSLTQLYTGRTGENGQFRLQRALLHFDLSSIPAGSTINSATLTLTVLQVGPQATGVALHKLTANWGESESTWRHAFLPGTPWTTPGGDYEPTATASTGNVEPDSPLVIPDLTVDVQSWVDNASGNYGWILRVTDEEAVHSAKLIASRESPFENARPVLSVTYTKKDPTACNHAVQSFSLVNADTHTAIMPIKDGDVIDLSTMPTQNLKIKAFTTPSTIGSMVFHLDGKQVAVEGRKPYRYGGTGKFTVGTHTLTATPYCGPKGTGAQGTTRSLQFQVIQSDPLTAIRDAQANSGENVSHSLQAFPNPFSEQTAILFTVPEPGDAILEVYDLKGALVERLYQERAEPGKTYTVSLKSKRLPNGVYITRLSISKQLQYLKLVLTK